MNKEPISIDYNTQRTQLVLPEYGRCIQQMVDHAKTLDDRDERLRCATTIVALMASMVKQHGDADEFRRKLWNHLAAIANYELDIDYPVEIETKKMQSVRVILAAKATAKILSEFFRVKNL